MKTNQIELIAKVCNSLPLDKIFQIANTVQSEVAKGIGVYEKTQGQCVTSADIQIQSLILQYFEASSLTGSYVVKAEEKQKTQITHAKKSWQLIIDPLDGTSSFCRQEKTWGVMVGACSPDGVIKYSWNLLSNGKVFSSQTILHCSSYLTFTTKARKQIPIRIDVYDYGCIATEGFSELFYKCYGASCERTEYPSAIWAGWKLYQGKLDGLLWIISDKGKRWYPDYDLIFLGALTKRGYVSRIATIDGKNALISVATSKLDVDRLFYIGRTILPQSVNKQLKESVHLQITTPI